MYDVSTLAAMNLGHLLGSCDMAQVSWDNLGVNRESLPWTETRYTGIPTARHLRPNYLTKTWATSHDSSTCPRLIADGSTHRIFQIQSKLHPNIVI